MPNHLFQSIVVLGIILLLTACVPIMRIYKMLAPGLNRRIWGGLAWIIGFSVGGNILFLWFNYTEGPDHHEDWLMSLICLAAAIFVFSVCMVSHSTVKDISRIADLELAARMDPLTELYNRRHILSLLEKECYQAKYRNIHLSILLLDIDRFKRINDTYGHQAGDFVLKEFARLLVDVQGGSDLIGRYGGEEFLVLLPDTTAAEAAHIGERLRYSIESAAIRIDSKRSLPTTVSIGVATLSDSGETPHELIALADKALYAAKAGGRNNVCVASQRQNQRRGTESSIAIPNL